MGKLHHYNIIIFEKSGKQVNTSYTGTLNRSGVIDFFGLNEPDVESYEIHQLD